jgi:hypothetical protein
MGGAETTVSLQFASAENLPIAVLRLSNRDALGWFEQQSD